MPTEKKKKGKAKGGFLACFVPSCVVDGGEQHGRQGASSGSYWVAPKKPSSSSARWSSSQVTPSTDEDGERQREAARQKWSSQRAIAKRVQSAAFVTSLETVQCKRARQGQQPSQQDEDGANSDAGLSCSSFSSSFSAASASSSNSIASSAAGSLPKRPMEPVKPPPGVGSCSDGTTGLCLLLLLILFVVIFWGRLHAIVWTSTCLCFVPRRRAGVAARRHEGQAEEVPACRNPRRR